jgi:hypothetical protein
MLLASPWLEDIKASHDTVLAGFLSDSLSLTRLLGFVHSHTHSYHLVIASHQHLIHSPITHPTKRLTPDQQTVSHHLRTLQLQTPWPLRTPSITTRSLVPIPSTCHQNLASTTRPNNMALGVYQHRHPKPQIASPHLVCRRTSHRRHQATMPAVQAITNQLAAPPAWIS